MGFVEGHVNGMAVIYNLHEVELRADEVVRCAEKPKLAKAG